jgi:mttA/Hcf106 family
VEGGRRRPYTAEVFEGLLAPWHLVIIALVVFLVMGPQKLADRWKGTTESLSRWADGDDTAAAPPAPIEAPARKKASLAQRFGRRLRRLRRRR